MAGKVERKYEIGEWVEVERACFLVYDDKERKTVTVPCNRIGQVVGGAFRMLGRYLPGGVSGVERDYDPPEFVINAAVYVYQVRFGFISKPVDVLPEHLKFARLDMRRKVNMPDRARKVEQPSLDDDNS